MGERAAPKMPVRLGPPKYLGHDSACPSRKYSTARRAPLTVSGSSQAYRPGKRCRRKRYLLLYFHSWLLGFQISL